MKATLVIVAVSVSLLLGGCAAGSPSTDPLEEGTNAPTPSASSIAKPTPTATAAASDQPSGTAVAVEPARITFDNLALTVWGGGGEAIATVSMYQSKESAVVALTQVFGFAPTVGDRPSDVAINAGLKVADFEGFMLVDPNVDDYRGWRFALIDRTPSVRGIAIEGPAGIRVGSTFGEAEAQFGASGGGMPGGNVYYYSTDAASYKVEFYGQASGGTISYILSPTGA